VTAIRHGSKPDITATNATEHKRSIAQTAQHVKREVEKMDTFILCPHAWIRSGLTC